MKKKCWNKNNITACLFIIVLFSYATLNGIYAAQNKEELYEDLEQKTDVADRIGAINNFVEDNVYLNYPIIEGYGFIQKLQLKHEFNNFDIVMDKEGYMYSGNFYNGFGDDQNRIAIEARKLNDYAKLYGAEFAFAVTPMKAVPEENAYLGIPYKDTSQTVEKLFRSLRYYNVSYLNLAEMIATSELSDDDMFYKTDHHWKTPAAFQAYKDIINWMEAKYQIQLDAGGKTRNLKNYTLKVYPNLMFGSEGRSTGKIYSTRSEDFEVYYPKENGLYTIEYGTSENYQIRKGGFDDALVRDNIDQKIKDVYKDSCYDLTFLYGLNDFIRITNHDLPQGPKLLMIRDSYASPLGCYMAQNFGQIDMVYVLGSDRANVLKMIRENEYDYVIMCIFPENLVYDNLWMFGEDNNE